MDTGRRESAGAVSEQEMPVGEVELGR